MKKLFTLFALCTLIFSACESQQTTPTPTATKLQVIDPANSILEVLAEGGNYEIKYQLVEGEVANETRSAAPLKVSATSEAKWISNITITNSSVKFTVAANNGGAREDYMQISYGDQFAIIMIQQLGYEAPDVIFNATHLGGSYFGRYITEKGLTNYNYFVILGNMQAEHYQSKLDGATEYRFDIYSDVSSAFNKTHHVPVGTYKIDHSRSGRAGTIDGNRSSSYYFSPEYTTAPYSNAVLVVTEDSIVAEVTLFDGEVHRIEYSGSTEFEDYVLDTFADVYPVSQYTEDITFNVTGGSINARFRGDYYGTGCDVWFIDMVEEKSPYNGVYLIFDLLVPKNGGYDNLDNIVGEYTIFNERPSDYAYTIPMGRLRDDSLQMHAWYLVCDQSQVLMGYAAPFTAGTIKVTKDGNGYKFEINGKDDNGNDIIGTFAGFISEYTDQGK